MFKNAKHSVQNSLSLILNTNKSINSINNIAGMIKVPDTMFQTIDNIQVILAPAMCGTLSCPRYLGHIPTSDRAITDRNGRN